ncbi:phosphatases II [Gymnopus androsaceus JB14]|uniref:Phosphatases II n=1 Tax=Gymnopus androsaceus JB14 TaxID=1447944 RepID=A0A6A4IGK2_9AGAR|nr:phosphatases II [Gymnopus androsaceus JB14]
MKLSFETPSPSQPNPNPNCQMPNLPSWLQSIYNPTHIRSALVSLAEREDIRIGLRQVQSIPNRSTADNPQNHGYNHSESQPKSASPARSAAAENGNASSTDSYYSVYTGSLPENGHRNRYVDILPYDRTRVRVRAGEAEVQEGEYLNANWVREKFGGKWWIASQAPLRNTAYTFLSLILDKTEHPHNNYNSSSPRTIVQLTQNIEGGRRKAHPYFPDTVGQTIVLVPDDIDTIQSTSTRTNKFKLKVTLLNREKVPEACCVKSTVSVIRTASDDEGEEDTAASQSLSSHSSSSPPKPRTTFTHLLFYAWPDHSVPTPADRAALVEFIHLVDKVNRDALPDLNPNLNSDSDPPIIVNCSAGIGRTGSFVAMNSLLRYGGFLAGHGPAGSAGHNHGTENGSTSSPSPESDVSSMIPDSTPATTLMPPLPANLSRDLIAQEIDSLRDQRPGMVQRPEQAVLVYEVVAEVYGRR